MKKITVLVCLVPDLEVETIKMSNLRK